MAAARHWPAPRDAQACALAELLHAATGVVLGPDRESWMRDRLEPLLNRHLLDDWSSVIQLADRDSEFRQELIDDLLTNETRWCRDPGLFQSLPDALLADARHRARPLRLAFLGCATGQEVYSVLIALDQAGALRQEVLAMPVEAVDVSRAALHTARQGVYSASATARGLSDSQRQRFFSSVEDGFRICQRLRECVRFRQASLLHFRPAQSIDWLFCRNVLVYFPDQLRAEVSHRLLSTMSPGGHLVLGASESPSGEQRDQLKRCSVGGVPVYRLR